MENPFEYLSPNLILKLAESHLGKTVEPHITTYPSYVNRVYGVKDLDDREFVIKIYRPQRWSEGSIQEEHDFLRELSAAEIPVVCPIPDEQDFTLGLAELEGTKGALEINFAMFPKKQGRLYEASQPEDWLRMGALISRMHRVGKQSDATERLEWSPGTIGEFLKDLLDSGCVDKKVRPQISSVSESILDVIDPFFDDLEFHRIHGDLHRANILERPEEGLMLIDFDDMSFGLAIQDFWLLLGEYFQHRTEELRLLIQGYRQFLDFDLKQLKLIEAHRFMRMLHFNHWAMVQRNDKDFARHFPGWGSKGFWIKELEDLRDQYQRIKENLSLDLRAFD